MQTGSSWGKKLILHIHEADYLKSLSRYNIYFELWYENTRITLRNTFGSESEEFKKFSSIKFMPMKSKNNDLALRRKKYIDGLEEAVEFLKKCIQNLAAGRNSLVITSDVRVDVINYLEEYPLPSSEKEELIKEIDEIASSMKKISKSQHAWAWQVQVNKVVKLLNKLVNLVYS